MHNLHIGRAGGCTKESYFRHADLQISVRKAPSAHLRGFVSR
jgi:hypothetical protein